MAYLFNDNKEKVDAGQWLKKELLDTVYPVGSIYMSVNNVSPATFLGGVWSAINGRFLVAQGSNGQSGNNALNLSAGATGGETNHTLSTEEMPEHSHIYGGTAIAASGMSYKYRMLANGNVSNTDIAMAGSSGGRVNMSYVDKYVEEHNVGQNGAHNNLPPYLAVYMWKRTS